MSDSLRPQELQPARPPCPSPTSGVHPNSCPLSWWCHWAISSFVAPFSSWPQSFPASGSFPVIQFFTSGGQTSVASSSASVRPMNIQHWFPLGLTGLSPCSPRHSWVFSSITSWKHKFFGSQSSIMVHLTSVQDYWKNYSFDYTDLCLPSNVSAF